MKYPAPLSSTSTKEMEELVKQITRYQKGSSQIREKLSKLKAAHRKVTQSIRVHEVLSVTSAKDANEAKEKLSLMKQQSKDFDAQLQRKGKQFENNMFALEELKEGITSQTQEVWNRITSLQASCQDWRFAHQLNSDVCSNARTLAFGSFYRWALVQPLLKIWMATDSQVHRTTYATAHYEGIYEELMAHFEVKDSIEQFGEDHYAVYRDTEDLVRTVKQATEERVMRTELLDQAHAAAARKLQRLVSSCRALQKEIDQRESLRFKLNGLMMELSNALDTDVRAALEVCEVEATKPSSVTVTDLHRAAQEGTLMEPATLGGAGDPFSAREDSPTTRSAGIRSSKDPTVTNTALNGVSKLPFLVRADAAARSSGEREGPRDGEVEVGHGTGPVGGPTSPPRARAPPSMHDSVYAQLPQYDNSAIAYVQSFHAPRRTKSWRWCRASAREVTKCAQALHPTVRGPVELVIQTEEDAEKMKPVAPGSPKTKNVPSFRRRAGQSSKIPTMSDGKNVAGVNLFSRERISVGSEGIPPEWLASHAPATVAAGSAGENGVGPGSPTESTELLRRRALKFMLSNRETHYDLMDREVVDAVTILQMEQARAVAAARQQREQEAARGGTGAAGAASELDSHQFRTHQLLTEDYSGRQPGEDGDDELDGKASDEYSLYVSLPQMSAHTALTARQAVRTMQCASAGITMETIAKIAKVLHDATSIAISSRAGTAEGPHRSIYGSGAPAHRPSPPHSPGPAQRQQFRQFSSTLASASATATAAGFSSSYATSPSRGRLPENSSSLEALTASALDAAPIELQAQDLNEQVAAEFRVARESVEDWIETHVQCNYKHTKRSLVELIANLNMDLHVPLDRDDAYLLQKSGNDLDDSSVDVAIAQLQLSPSRPLTPSGWSAANGPASMNMTLKNMLDVSKNLIGSIQENLREFAGKNHDFHLPDDITLHRRPNSAGALAGHSSSGAGIGRSGEERFFEDDGDDQAFDPDNYAFTRRSPGGSASGSRNQGGDDLQTVAPSSPSRSAQLTALMQSHAQPSGSAAWPTKRTLLNSMESIICGDLFVVDYFWNPAKTSTELIAKNFVSKQSYTQCTIVVSPSMISDLTNTPRDLALHTLFHDTAKVTQAIIASLTNETIDEHFYSEIVRAYRQHSQQQQQHQQQLGRGLHHGRTVAGIAVGASEELDFVPQWSLLVIEEMLHPKNITRRRGSISQLYRPSSSEKVRGGSPEGRMSKHIAEALQETGMVGKREFEHLMHILTMRKKSGELLAYSFPTMHEIVAVEAAAVGTN